MEETAFCDEAEFRRRLRAYIKHCDGETQRLPNVAGFCRFCGISRSAFAASRARFPLCYDLAISTFIDEALNRKALNTAATMTFLLEQMNGVAEESRSPFRIVCAHDGVADGE